MCTAKRLEFVYTPRPSEEVDFAVGLLEELHYAEGFDAATPGDELIDAPAGRMPKRDGGALGGDE